MELLEVKDAKTKKAFLELGPRLYQGVDNWIRPLNKDIEAVFDPKQNKTFRHGKCIRWILNNGQGETIGHIAAFVNKRTATKDNDQPTGGVGFFECIDDQEAANLLFDRAKAWLEAQGMEAMDGPINFGERDKWWGLLVEGFDREPNYNMHYHHSYYQKLFEDYGFQLYFKQFTFARPVTNRPLKERLQQKADMIASNPDIHFRHLRKSEIEQFTKDFQTVYNKAWASTKGVSQMPLAKAKAIMKSIKPIMDERIIWFGYHKDEPISFFICLPEVNQIFKHLNGQFDWLAKLKFVYHRWRGSCRKAFGVVFGIVPEFQGKGVDGAMIEAFRVMVQEKHRAYDEFEMNWIGDFNPRMINMVKQTNADIVKTHHTYRYLFDRSKPFERMPMKG